MQMNVTQNVSLRLQWVTSLFGLVFR